MRMKRLLPWLALVVVSFPAAATGGKPPPGATALCRDRTYSFAAHHSGTCSHHGGVAQWLDARPTGVILGQTIALGRRTLSSGCKLGANPDRRCSPGAYYSALTKQAICSTGYRTDAIRNVPDSEKFAVEGEYGLTPGHYGSSLEIDHIVSLELGGSNDIANLFPEREYAHPGYRVKDKLENRLHAMVCAGQIDLRVAQRGIATDWQALYRKVFGIDLG